MRRTCSLAIACMAMGGCAARDAVQISDIAPSWTSVVVEIPNAGTLIEATEKTRLRELLQHPAFGQMVRAMAGREAEPEMGEILARLGIDEESLSWPVGAVGVAFFYENDVEKALNEDSDSFFEADPRHVSLVLADFGEGADGIEDAIEALIEFGVEQEVLAVESLAEDVVAVRLLAYEDSVVEYGEEVAKALQADKTGDPIVRAVTEELRRVEGFAYARVGNTFIASSSREHVERSLGAMRGGAIRSAASEPFYAQGRARVPRGAYAWLITNDALSNRIGAARQEYAARHEHGLYAIPPGMFETERWSIPDATACAFSLVIDPPGALAEVITAIIMPEKRGVFALADAQGTPYQAPNLLPAFSVGTMRMQVDRAALPAVVEMMVGLEPDDEVALDLMNAIGEEIHLAFFAFDRRETPAAESEESAPRAEPIYFPMLIAVQARDETALVDVVESLAGDAGRHFEGTRIFDDPSTKGGSTCLGIGHGFAIWGQTSLVESALRASGRSGVEGLAADDRFRQALESAELGSTLVGYLNTDRLMEWLYRYVEEEGWERGIQARSSLLPDIQFWRRYAGDVVLELAAAEWGFGGRIKLLPPREVP